MNKLGFIAAAILAGAGVSPALAQDAAAPAPAGAGLSVGATVYGPQGNPVGTIEQVQGDIVVVNTGTLSASLPSNVFGTSDKGPTISLTKTDLEAAITVAQQQSSAAIDAALVAGTEVYSADAMLIGPIESVGADGIVVVKHANGPVSLPKDQMAMQGDKLTFRANMADLLAAMQPQGAGLDTALVEGAEVFSSDGMVIGKVTTVNADGIVVVEHTSGPVSLPKAQMAVQDGKLTFLATMADLQAAMGQTAS